MARHTKIYVYRTPSGIWADCDYNKAINNELLETHNLNDPDKVINNPGKLLPGRVKALAERIKADRAFYKNTNIVSGEVLQGSFWRRMRWLFRGN